MRLTPKCVDKKRRQLQNREESDQSQRIHAIANGISQASMLPADGIAHAIGTTGEQIEAYDAV